MTLSQQKLTKLIPPAQSSRWIAMSIALATSACNNPISTMDDMKESTTQMSSDTQNMKSDTHEVLITATRTDKNLSATKINQTQGGSLKIRNDALDAMVKTEKITDKIKHAVTYFSGFEFQLSQGVMENREEQLENYFDIALKELFITARGLIPINSEPSTTVTDDSDDSENLYALAFGLDSVNPNSEIPQVSILSLIEDTLARREEIRKANASDIPAYQRTILANQFEAEHLLKVRANFLPALVLGQISNLNEGNWITRKSKGLLHVILSFKWKPVVENKSPEEIEDLSGFIKKSLIAHRYLESIGVANQTDPLILRAFMHMKPIPLVDSQVRDAEVLNKTLPELNQSIQDFIAQHTETQVGDSQ